MIGEGGPPSFESSYFDIATGGELATQTVFNAVLLPFVWAAQDNRLWQITSAKDAMVRLLDAQASEDIVTIGF